MALKNRSTAAELDGIGKRIREIRIRRGMTQEKLSGKDITRNMLSRIENGAALPSLPTLCVIAERLGVPTGALLGDLGDYVGWHASRELKTLLYEKKYEKLISLCNSADSSYFGSSVYEILCEAHIEYASQLYLQGRLTAALDQLDKADSVNTGKLREDENNRERIFVLREIIGICSAKKTSDASKEDGALSARYGSIIFKNNDAVYLYCLSRLSGITGTANFMPHERADELRSELNIMISRIDSKLYKTHIDAKLDMISAEYLDAKAKLITILTLEPPPSILYNIYTDLEFCCKCCGDFENAYKYARIRLELIQRID